MEKSAWGRPFCMGSEKDRSRAEDKTGEMPEDIAGIARAVK